MEENAPRAHARVHERRDESGKGENWKKKWIDQEKTRPAIKERGREKKKEGERE